MSELVILTVYVYVYAYAQYYVMMQLIYSCFLIIIVLGYYFFKSIF